jgi:hypothetical protein
MQDLAPTPTRRANRRGKEKKQGEQNANAATSNDRERKGENGERKKIYIS